MHSEEIRDLLDIWQMSVNWPIGLFAALQESMKTGQKQPALVVYQISGGYSLNIWWVRRRRDETDLRGFGRGWRKKETYKGRYAKVFGVGPPDYQVRLSAAFISSPAFRYLGLNYFLRRTLISRQPPFSLSFVLFFSFFCPVCFLIESATRSRPTEFMPTLSHSRIGRYK